jgi:dephospho-CoA kinase
MIIGITGGIATGKSFFTNYLRDKGYQVICADEISKKVVEKDEKGYFKIIEHFGNNILDENKNINRKQLGYIIFNNEEKRLLLNNIVHPLVKQEMINKIQSLKKDNKIIFIDVPLLFESSFDDLCDKIVVVYSKYEIQLKRLMERDKIEIDLAKNKINAQMDLSKKVLIADYVIDNSFDKENTIMQFEKFLKEVQEYGI